MAIVFAAASLPLSVVRASAQATPSTATPTTIVCASKPGEREQCAADTSAGVVLVKSTGAAACLLGKTWGYYDKNIWVADGGSGEFATRTSTAPGSTAAPAPRHVPNVGFLI